jgi:transcriptional regulator with XRE-family HTH domain
MEISNIKNINMDKNTKNWYSMSDLALLEVLGTFMQKTRLNQNKTQQTVSDAAGINRSTLLQIEKGKSGTLLSFIQILRALEQLHLLEAFDTKQELSPLQLAKLEKKKRLRASKKQTTTNKPKSTW